LLARRPGQLQAGLAQLALANELSQRMGTAMRQFFSLALAAYLLIESGNLGAAEKTLASLHKLLKELPDRQQQAIRIRVLEALLLRHQGKLAESVQQFQSELELLRQGDDLGEVAHTNIMLADAWLELNDLPAAAQIAADSLSLAQQGYLNVVEPLCLLSTIRARQGETAEAQRYLAEAEGVTGHTPGHTQEIALALAAARLAAAEKRWPEAIAGFDAAAGMAGEMGLDWYQAQFQREWAEVYLARGKPGDREQARALLEAALAACQAMKLPEYERQIRARLGSLR
jgi:uncharacterized protein HemY